MPALFSVNASVREFTGKVRHHPSEERGGATPEQGPGLGSCTAGWVIALLQASVSPVCKIRPLSPLLLKAPSDLNITVSQSAAWMKDDKGAAGGEEGATIR